MTTQPSDAFYVVGTVQTLDDAQAVLEFLVTELRRVQAAFEQQRQLSYYSPQDALPSAPYNGQIGYFAAGVAGAGEGFYGYEAGSWTKL